MKLECCFKMTHNAQGFAAGVALVFRPPTAAAEKVA
jgi:hypothetical protein